VPFKPQPQFDPQVTVQPEFQQDSDEQFVQDWLVAHKSPWRLARINGEMHYMLVYENANPKHIEIWGF
jgi:hypothetical protein